VGAWPLRKEVGALLKGREIKVAVISTFVSVLILLVSFVLFYVLSVYVLRNYIIFTFPCYYTTLYTLK
jgi:hypothetical protein